jgi:hypothetical protein
MAVRVGLGVLKLDLGEVGIPLPLPEDLIIMKAVAHRPRDLGDIEAMLAAHPELNPRRVRHWVRVSLLWPWRCRTS